MSNDYHIFIWKRAPFLRLLSPFIAGIIFQFYMHAAGYTLIFFAIAAVFFLFVFSFLSQAIRFRFKFMQGMLLSLLLLLLGSFVTLHNDVRNQDNWYGHFTVGKTLIVATITEPLQEKANSFKATAAADVVIENGKLHRTAGKILIYFSKDSVCAKLKYGDRIIVNKLLRPILNSGNPAAFDYAQYSAFHNLYHEVYLKPNDWRLLSVKNKNGWHSSIFSTRQKVISVIEKYLGKNDESSIAKALLIGYKVDLDKDLVQAYSNAGVVHIIAISGLHIGIIYAILLWVFSVFPFFKRSKPVKLLLILSGLWLFALVTGASSSVVRAALMFSFIVVGKAFDKKGSVYNSIAASAFFLLCFNPFLLWDVGFQLSYLAVAGIVIAQKPISNWFYFKNEFLERLWQLATVSLSAQLFTFPLCMFYFHQLPMLFLFSNLVAIPLATIILCGCLILVIISPVTSLGFYFAKIVYACIWLLNHFILFFDSIPYSLWNGISISAIETLLLYFIVCFSAVAFIQKKKIALKFAIAFLFCLVCFRSYSEWKLFHQKKIIVYNIPKHRAVEFIDRNTFSFAADTEILHDRSLYNYHVKPVQVAFQLNKLSTKPDHLFSKDNFYQFYDSKILMIDSSFSNYTGDKKIRVSYILISNNPKIKISKIAETFDCTSYIFDASNASWKIEQWKKECEELHLHFHSVPEQGAFVVNL
jgi:competence protein ComEC